MEVGFGRWANQRGDVIRLVSVDFVDLQYAVAMITLLGGEGKSKSDRWSDRLGLYWAF